MTSTGLQLRSLVKEDSTLELSLQEITLPKPGPDEVLVRVEATPINPSDLALLIGPADMSTASACPCTTVRLRSRAPRVL